MNSNNNNWTILKHINKTTCEARCICGKVKLMRTCNILDNRSKSCGCVQRSSVINAGIPEEFSERLIRIFSAMKQRCYNENNTGFKNYGAKGITICDEWLNNSHMFYKWSIENGYNNALTIDRIESRGEYSPSNCRWVSLSENISEMCERHKRLKTGGFSEDSYEKIRKSNKQKLGRKLKLIDKLTNLVLEFDCLISAAEYIVELRQLATEPLQIKKNISACLHGKRKTVHGFTVEEIDNSSSLEV